MREKGLFQPKLPGSLLWEDMEGIQTGTDTETVGGILISGSVSDFQFHDSFPMQPTLNRIKLMIPTEFWNLQHQSSVKTIPHRHGHGSA